MSVPYAGGYLGLGNSFTSQNRAVEAAIGGWVEIGRTTLGSAGDAIDVTSLADKRYYMVLTNIIQNGNYNFRIRMNADTGNNYTSRISENGATDATATATDQINFTADANTTDCFNVGYAANLDTTEKLWQSWLANVRTAGAATAPFRGETVGKHVQTTVPIDEFNIFNNFGSSKFATGSECVVLAWDPADTHTDNFWELLDEVDLSGGAATTLTSNVFTSKKYLWIQMYQDTKTANAASLWRVGNTTIDTGSNYAQRFSLNGATDGTSTSVNTLHRETAGGNDPIFTNIFVINNASNEKLAILHSIDANNLGAANAPGRYEAVCKWTDTTNQIDIVQMYTITQTMGTNTQMKIWGSD